MLSILLTFALGFAQADVIIHHGYCAGMLNPRAGKVLASKSGEDLSYYVINGRLRRVSLATQDNLRDFAELPEDRIEVPMVNERLPLYTRVVAPIWRNVFDSNLARRARVLFNDRRAPKMTMVRTGDRLRFTYGVANGSRVQIDGLKRMAEFLYVKGFGRNRVLAQDAPPIEVAIGGHVYSGPAFYEFLARAGEAEARTRWQAFARFVTGLSLKQLARNTLTPANQKIGFRPRYVFSANKDGDLTSRLMTDIAVELDERTNGASPETYDVVVGGRAFSGEDFEKVRARMITDDVVSIDAERGFENSLGGAMALGVSWAYTLQLRLYGLVAAALVLTPDATLQHRAAGLAIAGTVAGASLTGTVIDRLTEPKEFYRSGLVKRTFRLIGYALPNFAGLFDSASYNAVEARRAQLIAENVGRALRRYDANDVVIIVNDRDDIPRINRAFTEKFGGFRADGDHYPLRGSTAYGLRESHLEASWVNELNTTFGQRDFDSAAQFLAYFDPARIPGLADVLRTPEDTAWVAYYFFKNLRAALPVFRRCGPTADENAALADLPNRFGPYEFVPGDDVTRDFKFKALRYRPVTGETGE